MTLAVFVFSNFVVKMVRLILKIENCNGVNLYIWLISFQHTEEKEQGTPFKEAFLKPLNHMVCIG